MAKSTKINITNDREKIEKIKVKDAGQVWTEKKEQIDGELKQVYGQNLGKIERPITGLGKIIWLIIAFSLFFGAIAGSIGGFFILTSDKISIPFSGEIDLKKYFPTRVINVPIEKKITVTQDIRLADLAKDLRPQIAKIFLAKKTTASGETTALLDQIYAPQEALGNGFILTNDGWFVFAKNSLIDLKKNYVIILDNKILSVEKMASDPVSKIVLVKTTASDLVVAKMANREEINIGQQIITLNAGGDLNLTTIGNVHYREIKKTEDLIRSTDHFDDLVLLEKELSEKLIGSPIFTLDKSVAGILVAKNLMMPSTQFANIIPLILQDKQIMRPYLGLNYLSLSEAPGLTDPRFKDFNSGAIIWGLPVKNSPAEKAGLQKEDLVTKIDGLPINDQYNLTELVQDHQIGDTVELTIVRDGIEKNIKIILGGI